MSSLLTVPARQAEDLIQCFLGGRNARTLQAYRVDLRSFGEFLNTGELLNCVTHFLGVSPGEANGLVLRYRNFMVDAGLQASTINRRLAAIRSLVKMARTLGYVTWSIEISNLKVEAYRDTRGPGLSNFCRLMALAEGQKVAKAKRDAAILRLLYDLALRSSELTNLDLSDFDPQASTLAVSAKGKAQKEILSLPESTRESIQQWIEVRGDKPGPLIYNFDRAGKGERLTRNGLYRLVRKFGLDIGISTRPHGLRHLSITEACKVAQANGFGLEEVLDHSRHSSVATLMIYRDRERNIQGEIAGLVAEKARAKHK